MSEISEQNKKNARNYIWEKFSYLNSLLLSCDICKPFRYSDIVGTKLPHDFYLPFRYPDMFSSGYRTVKLLQTKVWFKHVHIVHCNIYFTQHIWTRWPGAVPQWLILLLIVLVASFLYEVVFHFQINWGRLPFKKIEVVLYVQIYWGCPPYSF